MSKSFTTIEQNICIVTGKPFDTGALLLDKKMREKFDMYTPTGWGFSPEVQEKLDQDYVALVCVDYSKSKVTDGRIMPEDAYRTGAIAYLRRHVLKEIVPDLEVKNMTFVDAEFMVYLETIQHPDNKEK